MHGAVALLDSRHRHARQVLRQRRLSSGRSALTSSKSRCHASVGAQQKTAGGLTVYDLRPLFEQYDALIKSCMSRLNKLETLGPSVSPAFLGRAPSWLNRNRNPPRKEGTRRTARPNWKRGSPPSKSGKTPACGTKPKSYRRLSGVTHDGGYWIAQRDTVRGAKPGDSTAWRLAVRRGKQGRKPPGKDGKDLR